MRILIVDDHAVVRRGLKEILEDEFQDAAIGEAENAPEAFQRIREQGWDVVILDITLPGGSGLDALKDIKHLRPDLPVLVLSMHPEDQYAVRVLRAGASGYLTKEAAPEELVAATRKALRGGTYVTASLAEKLASDLSTGGEKPPDETLSDREYEVMCLIASGKAVSRIAEELSLSAKTISTYRSRALAKMGMKTNAELIRYALRRKLVD